ncbi:FH2 domain-containing protein 1-like [Synchiropus splendidus]|uniref:FH2 domain-containing protein 1-like n=1 Tax=Synchiropus splendidus TaxID=270530 RepID=UPI00237EA8CE|nr:FH2 domain-containing protein 1-like [Synchiropus splendidus]XP_053716994.1 FH2 domain-containing protein 1-like [Synchiropus splendidus]
MHVMGSASPANDHLFFDDGEVAPSCKQSTGNMEEDQREPPPPPPPPPPPLHPPPPLPPLLPALGDLAEGLRKKKRVRSFYWKTIPEEQVKGRANLWTLDRVQEKYQIDVQTIEELFGQNESSQPTVPLSRGGKARGSFRETKDEVCILDAKRGMNIGIFLKQFKRASQVIVDDIHHGNSEAFGVEPLKELLKLLPETEEVSKLGAYRGDVSKLSLADTFVYLLIQIPSYSVRIEAMLLKEEFPAASEAMKRDIGILRSATKEVMSCEELHAVLHLVLQAGNILNAGGYAGNAVGFKLSSLLSLADTKANKPGMNLLHFVALEAQKKDKQLLEFPLKLNHVESASRISVETLDNELQSWTSRTSSVEENVRGDTELLQQLDAFFQSSTLSLCSLRDAREQLYKEGNELMDFFCEDRETFRLDDCFGIFHRFCCRFTDAVKENQLREAKESARRRRLQELEEQKRHSWSGAEEVNRTFGTRCNSDTDMTAGKTGLLMELLSTQSQSPSNRSHGPFGRCGSSRRSRNPPSNSPAVKAEHDLSTLLDMAEQEQQVTLRRGRREERTTSSHVAQSPKLTTDTSPKIQQPLLRETDAQTASSPASAPTSAVDGENNAVEVNSSEDKPTSDTNQRPDHNNNGSDGLSAGSGGQVSTRNLDECLTSKLEPDMVWYRAHNALSSNISMVLERHKLVPKLQAFDIIFRTHGPSHHGESPPDDNKVRDLEVASDTQVQKEPDEALQQCGESAREKDEEPHEDSVVVWCVTGVCEAAEDTDVSQTENDNHDQQDTFATANHTPAECHLTNEPVPLPISSQPVPASHSEDSPLLLSSTRWTVPLEDSSSETVCPEGTAKSEDLGLAEQAELIDTAAAEVSEEPAPSTEETVDASTSVSKKTLDTSKTQTVLERSLHRSSKHKPVRTLTNSENQGMRRVVPITRASLDKQKPPLQRQLLTSASLRRVERPSSAPSSRRSSIHKPADPKDPDKKAAVAVRNQNFQRKPSVRKPVEKPKPEEKMCRSTLRALAQAQAREAAGGGGGSASAPVTPVHKHTAPSSCPSFARNTASSSFRQTSWTTIPQQTHSPKSSKSSSSSSSSSVPCTAPSLTRTFSTRLASNTRASSPSSPQKNVESIRAPPRSPLTSARGHKRSDSGSLSDKSGHSRELNSRPSWR